jgi:hypothetical protein
MTDRYDTAPLPEDQHEPGSNGVALRNLLGITDKAEMEHVEENDRPTSVKGKWLHPAKEMQERIERLN